MADLPKAPSAVVFTAYGNIWVEETAKKVWELRSDAMAGISEDSGGVCLTGLESTGKTGSEGLAPYTIHLDPHSIGGVRSMTQDSFENTINALSQAHQATQVPTPPEGGGAHSGSPRPRTISPELDFGETCCCGHLLGSHDASGTEMVGGCLVDDCGCGLFHTHDG